MFTETRVQSTSVESLGNFVRVNVLDEGSTVIPRTPHMTALQVVHHVALTLIVVLDR